MNDLQQAAEMALKALENVPIEYDFHDKPMDAEFCEQLKTTWQALRQALEERVDSTTKVVDTETPKDDTQAFPVGLATITNGYPSMWVFNPEYVKNNPNTTVTLYTTPPKSQWVDLTDEEIGLLTVFDGLYDVETPLLADFVRAIEVKLKEKNT